MEPKPDNRLSLIFAIDRNGVIGNKGQLPWDYPEDRAYFFEKTRGHAVIMGRRTWEESGRPLPERTNIVVSRAFTSAFSDVRVVASLDAAIALARTIDDEPFVIGGVRMFEEALPLATRIYLTEIPGEHEGDAILRFDRSHFRVVSESVPDSVERSGLRFLILEPLAPPG